MQNKNTSEVDKSKAGKSFLDKIMNKAIQCDEQHEQLQKKVNVIYFEVLYFYFC